MSLRFSNDDEATIENFSITGTPLTMACWYFHDTSATNNDFNVMSLADSGSGDNSFRLAGNQSGGVRTVLVNITAGTFSTAFSQNKARIIPFAVSET